MKNVLLIGGTRPNFIKLAPVCRELNTRKINYDILHTGQHYNYELDKIFFQQFGLKTPVCNLGVGSGSHGFQTAKIIEGFDQYCFKNNPKNIVVIGDVNSTMACSIVTSKIKDTKLFHIEAGGRIFDMNTPEEINRIITDRLSDYLFAIEKLHVDNLINEGIEKKKIFLVGDVLIDNLKYYSSIIEKMKSNPYLLITIHRRNTIKNIDKLTNVLRTIDFLSKYIDVFFPIHPHTVSQIKKFGLSKYLNNIFVVKPLGYFDFIKYLKGATLFITDSGGAYLESAFLNIPFLVLRNKIERNLCIKENIDYLVDTDYKKIINLGIELIKNPIKVNICGEYETYLKNKITSSKLIVDEIEKNI